MIVEYSVAPEDGQTEQQARDLVINVMRNRIGSRGIAEAVVIPRGTSGIHVELPGEPDEVARTLTLLERSAALGIHPIVEDDAGMQAIYDAAMQEKPAAIFPMVDTWMGQDDQSEHRAVYLWSADPKELETWLHARPPVQQVGGGRRLVLQHEDVSSAQGPSRWRTHVIDLAAVVTGKDVAKASVAFDQITMRPQVDMELTAGAAKRFGDATAAMTGRKLAIVLDSKVVSAPVIQSAITHGRIVITMGGSDPKEQQRDADDLVDVLKSGSMPAVLRLSERHVGPAR